MMARCCVDILARQNPGPETYNSVLNEFSKTGDTSMMLKVLVCKLTVQK